MKASWTTKFLVSAVLMVGSFQMAQAQQTPPKEVVIGVSDVFVPGGFDSEADTYVVVSGILPNGCYRWNGADVSSPGTFSHIIKSKALVSQGMCLMVLVPFTKEVRLGQLPSGEHKLRFVNGDGTFMERSMKVE
ncbi:MAG: hypothetical protein ACK5Y2_11960 [Bdellovibrionales bacterium]